MCQVARIYAPVIIDMRCTRQKAWCMLIMIPGLQSEAAAC